MMYLRLLFLACLAMGQKEHPGDELEPTGNTRQRTPFPWNGCSRSKPCTVGQGDCDADYECQAGTKCGLDNCRDFNARAHSLADCCVGDWVPGWCEDAEGKDQNAGVIEKANLNKEECLRACRNHQGATGCEFRVGQCSIHTRNVGGGNGNTGYSCMVFLNKVEYLLSQTIGAATIARYGTTSAGGPQCLQCLQNHAPRCISKYCGTKSGVVCAQCLYIENADICRAPCGVDYSQSLPIQRVLENTKGNCRTAYFVCEDEASTKPPQGCRSICNVPLRFDTLGSTLGLETAAGLPIKGCKAVYFHCTNFYLNFYSKPLPFSETCMTCCKDFFPVEQRGKPHSCNREQIRG